MTEQEKAVLRMLVEGMLIAHAVGEVPEEYARKLHDFARRVGVLDPDNIGPPSRIRSYA